MKYKYIFIEFLDRPCWMTFAIESVLELETKSIVLLGPFNPHPFFHPLGTGFSFAYSRQKKFPMQTFL